MVYFWKNVALNLILLYYLKDLTKKRERLRLHSTLVHLIHSPRVPWFDARRLSMFLLALRFLSVVSTQISDLPLVLFAQDTQDEAAWGEVQEVNYKLYFCTKCLKMGSCHSSPSSFLKHNLPFQCCGQTPLLIPTPTGSQPCSKKALGKFHDQILLSRYYQSPPLALPLITTAVKTDTYPLPEYRYGRVLA